MEPGALEPPILIKLVTCENEPSIVVVRAITHQYAKHTLIGMLKVAQLFTDQDSPGVSGITRERIEPETAYGSHNGEMLAEPLGPD